MERNDLEVGLKLEDISGKEWRIIYSDDYKVRVIEIGVTRRHIESWDKEACVASLSDRKLKVSKDQEVLLIDQTKLPEKEIIAFLAKKHFIDDFKKIYGPSFVEFESRVSDGSAFQNLLDKYGWNKVLAYRIIRKWMQSGMQESSLINAHYIAKPNKDRAYSRKTGRCADIDQGVIIDDEHAKNMQEAVSYYKNNRASSIRDAYVRMVLRHYCSLVDGQIELFPADQFPTERQFYYFLHKKMNHEELVVKKTSEAEYRNSNRLLMGTPRDGALRPGKIVEVDALEVDLQILSSYKANQNIGKPIVYFMVDIYSHGIVAFSVGYENNSKLGLSDLMLNLFEDKGKLLGKHGLDISPDLINYRFIPNEIRCDRGADFKSDYFLRVCQELGVKRSLVTGATGSLKGSVEQSFRQFQKTLRPTLLHMGIVQPRYDSKHYEEAILLMEDVFKLVVSFVGFYNSRSMARIKIPPEMIREGYGKTPRDIWNYGAKHAGVPETILSTNYHQVLYALMDETTAAITRRGISYSGLVYKNNDDNDLLEKMRKAELFAKRRNTRGVKINEMVVRIDPRSINQIYYLKDGKLMVLDLIPSLNPVRDISFAEYLHYCKADKLLNKEGERRNLKNAVTMSAIVESIGAAAEQRDDGIKPNRKGIRETRIEEKDVLNFTNSIINRISDQPALPEAEIPIEGTDSPSPEPQIIEGVEASPMPDEFPDDFDDLFD